jgi:hypothetical protein
MEKLCTNKNRSYKHNEQINKQNIDFYICYSALRLMIFHQNQGFH